jgi:hypothetical protein
MIVPRERPGDELKSADVNASAVPDGTHSAYTPSTRDIKILLFVSYAFGYVLAVLPPIFIDPLLKSHVLFSSRHYPYALVCLPIYGLLVGVQFFLLKRAETLKPFYFSVCVFLIAILITFPLFLPEFPHGNVFAVGAMTTFLSALSVFVWSISRQITVDSKSLRSAGLATLEYMKVLFAFVRQGAFAGVALFGALFLAAYATGFKFVEAVVTDKSELFLLNSNLALQIGYYAVYCVVGPVRYFFLTSIKILSQFMKIASRLDRQDAHDQRKNKRVKRGPIK